MAFPVSYANAQACLATVFGFLSGVVRLIIGLTLVMADGKGWRYLVIISTITVTPCLVWYVCQGTEVSRWLLFGWGTVMIVILSHWVGHPLITVKWR